MPRKKGLRAVNDGEVAAPVEPLTVTGAASGGSTRDLLVAMRDRVAAAVEKPDTPARDLAALTKRLVDIVRDIDAIDAREDESIQSDNVTDGSFKSSAI